MRQQSTGSLWSSTGAERTLSRWWFKYTGTVQSLLHILYHFNLFILSMKSFHSIYSLWKSSKFFKAFWGLSPTFRVFHFFWSFTYRRNHHYIIAFLILKDTTLKLYFFSMMGWFRTFGGTLLALLTNIINIKVNDGPPKHPWCVIHIRVAWVLCISENRTNTK